MHNHVPVFELNTTKMSGIFCQSDSHFCIRRPSLHLISTSLRFVPFFSSFTDLSKLCTQENVTTPAALSDSKRNELCLLLPSVVLVLMAFVLFIKIRHVYMFLCNIGG